jgi:hypothetical protein
MVNCWCPAVSFDQLPPPTHPKGYLMRFKRDPAGALANARSLKGPQGLATPGQEE